MSQIQIIIAGLITLACMSFLFWKENPFYTLVEHMALGFSGAYGLGNMYHRYMRPTVVDDIMGNGEIVWILPILLGLMIYFKYSNQLSWLARYPMSFWVGYGAGFVLAMNVGPMLTQVRESFVNLASLDQLVLFIAFVTTLIYFIFTLTKEGTPLGPISVVGRYAILIALGVSFGSTALYRFNLWVGRMTFLLFEFLPFTPPV